MTTRYAIILTRTALYIVGAFNAGETDDMKIIKRNGSEAAFDIAKIVTAITKANGAVEEKGRMTH